MTVLVIYHQRNERKEESFASEQPAAIFVEGLIARGDCRFDRYEYPNSAKLDPRSTRGPRPMQ